MNEYYQHSNLYKTLVSFIILSILLSTSGLPLNANIIDSSVTVPDSPGDISFNIHSLKDIQAADPGTVFNLIEPPQANNMGDARISYPIEIPPGRNGMQPNLALTYNSAGGNSWTGLGWDLTAPSITVETRWGVPRYKADYETETYLLNGEMLTPVTHRDIPVLRNSAPGDTPQLKEFHTRIEGRFRKILRHGDHPSNYWWEMVEKDGTRNFYGGNPENSDPSENATLDNNGNEPGGDIFKWALSETRDLNGNSIKYNCLRVEHTGLAEGSVPGYQLYLKSINYTRPNENTGAYTVTFIRDRELPNHIQRPDVTINARGGFKMVTADLLKRIDIDYKGQPIRSYELKYEEGPFKKTLLKSITQFGEDGSEFNTHTFTYYDEISSSEEPQTYAGFSEDLSWMAGSDELGSDVSALSGTDSINFGGHLGLLFNLEFGSKFFSMGGKIGFSVTNTDGVLSFIDVDGDNLPDKVFHINGQTWYRANLSGPRGIGGFAENAHPITSLEFFSESSETISGGAEAFLGANLIKNYASSFTESQVYFTDVNSDGLLDIVNNGQVYFNAINIDGKPQFDTNSGFSPVPIIGSSSVNSDGILPDYIEIYNKRLEASPLQDTLVLWIAPYDGLIHIIGDPYLIEDNSQERQEYETADGVHLAIQKNGTELWSTTISPDDYSVKPINPDMFNALPVVSGDRLYFRVQSIYDGKYDQVSWDPEIIYTTIPDSVTDVNNLPDNRYKLSEDYTFAGRPELKVGTPFTGTIQMSTIITKGLTTDDVELRLEKNGVPILLDTFDWDEAGVFQFNRDIQVNAEDELRLRAVVDSQIDLHQIEIRSDMYYVSATNLNGPVEVQDDNGNYIIQLRPPVDIDTYPLNSINSPAKSWTAPKSGTFAAVPDINFLNPFVSVNSRIVFTIKQKNKLVAKEIYTVTNNVVSPPISPIPFDVVADEEYYFEFTIYNLDGERVYNEEVHFISFDLQLIENPVEPPIFPSFNISMNVKPDVFGQPYRGWTFAGYNGNGERAAHLIIEEDISFDGFDKDSKYDPSSAKAYPFFPMPGEGQWRGSDDLGWVKPGIISSSRLGADYISVPEEDDLTGGLAVAAVPRIGSAVQNTTGAGAFGVSVSEMMGESQSVVDFRDMNGDLYPDVLGFGQIQYTRPYGILEENSIDLSNYEYQYVSQSSISSNNFGIGGNSADIIPSSNGGSEGSDSQMPSIGFGGSTTNGGSKTDYDHIDINGDGLPDRLISSDEGLMVAFNLGYKFSSPELWGINEINSSINDSLTFNGGFNDGIYGFGGGIAYSEGSSQTELLLADINGDGLADRIRPDIGQLLVSINTGNGFTPEIPWTGTIDNHLSKSSNNALGGGGYFTISIGPVCIAVCYIIINPGADIGESSSKQEVTLQDINGDGYLDQLVSTNENKIDVALNNTGRTNLLQSIERPLGARIDIEYERDGNTYEMPQSRWLMSNVIIFDGFEGNDSENIDGVDHLITSYTYEGGFYDRLERDFYGYAKVTENHLIAEAGEGVYRYIEREFLNRSFYTKGLLKREMLFDEEGKPYTETENFYELIEIFSGERLTPEQESGIEATQFTVFPRLIRVNELYFEGQPQPGDHKQTAMIYDYDALGNIISYVDLGDISPLDDIWVELEYPTCDATFVVGLPNKITVTSNEGLMRYREADIDCATANLNQVRQYLLDGSAAVTDLTYFPNGNLESVTGPANYKGGRYVLEYTYDPEVATYVASISDSFGYVSTATHNYKYGAVEVTTDLNGNEMNYVYDLFGRVDSITGPYEQAADRATIDFEYHPEAEVPWALTRHIDLEKGFDFFNNEITTTYKEDTIDTVLFIDGLKRVIQTKKDSTIQVGAEDQSENVMTVSGRVTFDFMGRTVKQYYPVTEPTGTPGEFNHTQDAIVPTETAYDVLDRTTSATIPDLTSTTIAYGFGLDRNGEVQFKTLVTDANGIEKASYTDVRELITSVQEFNRVQEDNGTVTQEIWTSYAYNPIKQIVAVQDNHNHITTVLYDNFGRRTEINNPDMGRVTTVYDLASNVIAKVTPNLRSESEEITYAYDFMRLTAINYPDFPGNNVTYSYGEPGVSDNRAGRITLVTDQSGAEERFYGKLGEITKEVKTVVRDRRDDDSEMPLPMTYTTEYFFDTWGRMHEMTYPDGERLVYRYDSGGQVSHAIGVLGMGTIDDLFFYVTDLLYDKFEQRAYMKKGEAGGTTITRYEYDPLDRRLSNLQTGKPTGNPFQNLFYTYDDVGNVTSLLNDVALPAKTSMPKINSMRVFDAVRFSPHIGRSEQQFEYDDLYRLTHAEGTYAFSPDVMDQYSLDMGYNTIHNITDKVQRHEYVFDNFTQLDEEKTYEWLYHYEGTQPHAPTLIEQNLQGWEEYRTYSYDSNGNQDGYIDQRDDNDRDIVWDEENRIQSIHDNDAETNFKYNDAGERVLKQSEADFTVYTNQHFTERNGEQGTKHVFIGTERVASNVINPTTPEEEEIYFFHPNHLGSTHYVTNKDGDIHEHLEYFPFGETWVEEWTDRDTVRPYKFTGKELDEETGLYYYGARYYDPRTSVWQSADPVIALYLDPSKIDPYSAPKKLGLYTYSVNNPVLYIDPNGLSEEEVPNESVEFDRDTNQSSVRNNQIQEYEALQNQSPDTYRGSRIYRKFLKPSAARSNMIAAAKGTKGSKVYNRVRWGLQDRIAKQELLYGNVNQKVKSTKYIHDIHESEFQTHGGVSTISELPWAILDKVDVTALLGQELGEKAIAASIEYLNPPDKDVQSTNFSWIRNAVDKVSEWTRKSYD